MISQLQLSMNQNKKRRKKLGKKQKLRWNSKLSKKSIRFECEFEMPCATGRARNRMTPVQPCSICPLALSHVHSAAGAQIKFQDLSYLLFRRDAGIVDGLHFMRLIVRFGKSQEHGIYGCWMVIRIESICKSIFAFFKMRWDDQPTSAVRSNCSIDLDDLLAFERPPLSTALRANSSLSDFSLIEQLVVDEEGD